MSTNGEHRLHSLDGSSTENTHDEPPLNGLTVIDLSVTLPGPYCTQVLHRLGAAVTAIEPPAGDSLRWVAPLSFAMLAQGKESVVANLKDAQDHALVMSLLAEADIIVEGWRPGVAERLGVGYSDVAAINPAAVYCSLSGYGATGELAGLAGHDINYVAEAGAADLVRMDGLPVGDLAGASAAATRILAGVIKRYRTGRGCHLDVSITGTLADWIDALGGDHYPQFLDVYQAPHYGAFPTRDGRVLTLGVAQEDRLWANLITALGRPEWAGLRHRQRNERRDEVRGYLQNRIAAMTAAELSKVLDKSDTCWSLVRTPGEVARVTGKLPSGAGTVPDLDEHGFGYRDRRGAISDN